MTGIYIIGVLICFLFFLYLNPDRSGKKIISYAFMSLFSWIGVFILLIAYLTSDADDI